MVQDVEVDECKRHVIAVNWVDPSCEIARVCVTNEVRAISSVVRAAVKLNGDVDHPAKFSIGIGNVAHSDCLTPVCVLWT